MDNDSSQNFPSLHAIVACDDNNGIGYREELLYRIKEDMVHFKESTMGHPIIIGRKTLDTFPKGLPLYGRINIILSKDTSLQVINGLVLNTVKDVLDFVKLYFSNDKVFVCGGESIYKQFLPYCDTIDMTRIYSKKRADSFFPELGNEWNIANESELHHSDKYDCDYRFITYLRK